jgi:AHAS-like ACT domain
MLHMFSVWLSDRPGVLNRVTSLFCKCGFSIQSLAVGQSERMGVCRMTIGVDIEEGGLLTLGPPCASCRMSSRQEGSVITDLLCTSWL